MIDRGYIWRTTLVVVALLLVWGGLAVRLGVLHLGPNDVLRERVRKMRTVEEQILVGRGRILDRNDRLLAAHGIVMTFPQERNIVRLKATEPDEPAQYARLAAPPVRD